MTPAPTSPAQQTTLVSDTGYLVRQMTTLSTGAATSIYTAGAGGLRQIHIVESILITNISGGAVAATAIVVHQASNNTDYSFYPTTSLANLARLTFPSTAEAKLDLPLEPSDELRLTGNGLTAIVVARVYQGNTK